MDVSQAALDKLDVVAGMEENLMKVTVDVTSEESVVKAVDEVGEWRGIQKVQKERETFKITL